ncbi:uncharacterized protein LOC141526854 isoform X2 [Cotesia typhae]|uniref:uncharacterized protein LOC141526854 isoform X2 n=1 Tax=Cotesia typhae TaxID=2053667 RepID=UPI003D68A7EC
MISSVLIVLLVQFFGIKGNLQIFVNDVIFPTYSEEYLLEPDVYLDADNKAVVNITIVNRFPPETQVHLIVLGASMGEYVIQTGFDIQMGLCETMEEPILVGSALRSFGFVTSDCPPSPGVYGTDGFVIPTDTLPDDFPANQYLFIFEILFEEEKIIEIYEYIHIQ